jgi:hypothetical protein
MVSRTVNVLVAVVDVVAKQWSAVESIVEEVK